MIIHEVAWGTPEYDELIYLRTVVLRIPLGLEFSEIDIASEWNQIHIAAYNNRFELMGCLVLKYENNGILKMRQVAVFEHLQRGGIGEALVKYAELYCKTHGFNTLELNSRNTAVLFYQKMKYTIIGNPFEEVGILHQKMIKKIQ